jgi:calcineurin-like phosphoesterase
MSGSGTTFLADPGCTEGYNAVIGTNNTGKLTIDGKDASLFKIEDYQNSKTGKGLIQDLLYATEYDGDTKKWTNGAEKYLSNIKNAAGENDTAYQLKAEQVTPKSDNMSTFATSVENQYDKDVTFIDMARGEYCYYSSRYAFFLNKFLAAVEPANNDANASVYLKILIELNKKINAFVSLMDHIANERAGIIDARTDAFNTFNAKLQEFNSSQSFVDDKALDAKKSILYTRKEMIRYTKEKNNSISNNISLWAALNVVAIAMIFTLYRKM